MNRFLIMLYVGTLSPILFADSAPITPAMPFESVIRHGETIIVKFRAEERHAHFGLNAQGYPQIAEPGQALTLKNRDTLNLYCERHGHWSFVLKPRFYPLPAGLIGNATYNPNVGGKDLSIKPQPITTVPVFKRAETE